MTSSTDEVFLSSRACSRFIFHLLLCSQRNPGAVFRAWL